MPVSLGIVAMRTCLLPVSNPYSRNIPHKRRTVRADIKAGIFRDGVGYWVKVGFEELGASLGAIRNGTSRVYGIHSQLQVGAMDY